MHPQVMEFAARALTVADVEGHDVIEAGSYNVNGSVRDLITGLGCASYTGADMQPGPGVDVVMDVSDLPGDLGAAGLVVSTSCLEHTTDWKSALRGMIAAVKPGGVLMLTCPAPGFPYHGYPSDYWRFTTESMGGIIKAAGLDVEMLEFESSPGICVKARKPAGWEWPDGAAAAWDAAEVSGP